MKRTFYAREAAMRTAHAHNKDLTRSFLEARTNAELVCFVHPSDREVFQKLLGLKVVNEVGFTE